MQNNQRISLALAFVLGGCASIVKKPEIDQVKKVAIVSLYARDDVPEKKGRGHVQGWDVNFKQQLMGDALKNFEAKFSKLGWQVVPGAQFVASKEYQSAFQVKTASTNKVARGLAAFGNLVQKVRNDLGFFTPKGMHAIHFSDENANTYSYGDAANDNPKNKLGALAKQWGLDAVIIVQLDYCYAGGTWSMAGTGEANITAGSSVRMINSDGKMVIDMKDIPQCEGETRALSTNTATMIGGDLMFAKLSKKGFGEMFQQATLGTSEKTYSLLAKELGK
jgi:hypothetical protein